MTTKSLHQNADTLHAPWLSFPIVRATFAALNQQGFETRIVGGAVRNALLGEAVQEIDFATTAPPEDVIRLAQAAGLRAVPTGLDHGTVTLVLAMPPASGPKSVEVTTLRRDIKTDGRHAEVRFGHDWAADAARRDFTMNALYVDANGALFDPMGGLADIKARRVRFIGMPETRIREDYLRILRFFRFAARYHAPDAPFDAQALAACTRARDGLAQLSGERIRAEMFKLLATPTPGLMRALRAMQAYGILHLIVGVPCLTTLKHLTGVEQTLGLPPDPVLRSAALTLHSAADALRLATRWRLSRAERTRLLAASDHHPAIFQDMRESAARAALYRLGPDRFRDRLLLAWARSDPDYQPGRWIWLFELPERWPVPSFPLKGADITALGLPEGPAIGRLLHALETYWIDRDFTPSRRHLLRQARKLARKAA